MKEEIGRDQAIVIIEVAEIAGMTDAVAVAEKEEGREVRVAAMEEENAEGGVTGDNEVHEPVILLTGLRSEKSKKRFN